MKVAASRILIYVEWSLFGYILFFIMNLILVEFLAFAIALIVTVGAFLHPRNRMQLNKLKRPRWEIKQSA